MKININLLINLPYSSIMILLSSDSLTPCLAASLSSRNELSRRLSILLLIRLRTRSILSWFSRNRAIVSHLILLSRSALSSEDLRELME